MTRRSSGNIKEQKNHNKALAQLRIKIEIIHPNNPVTKWFRGIMMVEVKETKGQGIMTLRRAIEEGAGKLVP